MISITKSRLEEIMQEFNKNKVERLNNILKDCLKDCYLVNYIQAEIIDHNENKKNNKNI